MSSTDHPESGVADSSNALESGATTTTPQLSAHPEHDTTKSTAPSPVTADTVAHVEPSPTSSTAAPQPSSEENAAATAPQHPATGGEPVAPIAATAATTTATGTVQSPALDTANTSISTSQTPADTAATPAALPTSAESPSMESHEPKATAEPSSDPSEVEDGKEAEHAGPALMITLLLTTGSRHPFTIDTKYLRKQSVSVENDDPFAMSVYTLKELIWREWRSDWETRPSSPSAIRLISFGKLLDDKSPLSDSRFSADHPNVVHMTVKPQEIIDEEDAKGAKSHMSREREASERSPGCRCIIQ
ncbi:Uncharacterized protein PECH_003103 [Penicillium ucsense]|uniref:UBL3-like ubiquitin domain-containing protein n=1 Tax=Penicillium ucsense TaxID=2839758 RepID=A0A8J8WAS3_9EURO|nr:Uncharacterized protein PECM_001870 [Penicillium ucsense]KAF7729812.1 Uncharacterized protein PECH_003103 [Penicillium ucsense]